MQAVRQRAAQARKSRRLLAVPPGLALAGALAFTIAIAVLDHVTGPFLRLFPLYFVPVALVAATRSRRTAALGALLATLGWAMSNVLPEHKLIYALNVVSQGSAFFVTALLVNGLKTFSETQRQLALTDALTGLHNGRAFREAARVELERQRRKQFPLTLAYLDIDDFKAINTRFGHQQADLLLGGYSFLSPVGMSTSFWPPPTASCTR